MGDIASKAKWDNYYKNHKEVWYNPEIPVYVKVIVRIVELHRSDSKGWSLSVRRISKFLNISSNTALKYLNVAIAKGYIEASSNVQRKRRKLRLSVSLRAPVEFTNHDSDNLSHWNKQPVSLIDTKSALSIATVNSKEISKDNRQNLSSSNQQQKPTHTQKKYEEYRKFVDEKIRGKRGAM